MWKPRRPQLRHRVFHQGKFPLAHTDKGNYSNTYAHRIRAGVASSVFLPVGPVKLQVLRKAVFNLAETIYDKVPIRAWILYIDGHSL